MRNSRSASAGAPQLGLIARHVGLDLQTAIDLGAGDQMIAAVERCVACSLKETCNAWISADRGSTRAPEFCPSAVILEDLLNCPLLRLRPAECLTVAFRRSSIPAWVCAFAG
jgi:hypothetical protein